MNVKEDTNLLEMSLDVLSITNIRRGSRLFYVHSGLAYIISFVAYYYLYKLWKDYIQLRIQYFKSKEFANAINNRMLLFTSIINPKAFSSELVKVDFEEAPAQILVFHD